MKANSTWVICLFLMVKLSAQPLVDNVALMPVKVVEHTPIKAQGQTGTCWSFSTTSLVESQIMRENLGTFDLSEMFVVRNIYAEKAKNYILRQGTTQFGPGGLGNDVIHAMAKFGAVPNNVYSGLSLGAKQHDHSELDAKLKKYLDDVLSIRPIAADWMKGFQSILDDHLGKVPETFTYREKVYTAHTFAIEVLKFKKDDYVYLTSFSHHPFYAPAILEIPDNYGSESYLNIPLEDLIRVTKQAVQRGYSVMWDADVSNTNFRQKDGFAIHWKDEADQAIDPDVEEGSFDQAIRQQLFETLTTQDDHLMHIVGIEKSKKGKTFFLVKNSWGEVGPFKGYIKVSEAYFAINTISLVVPKTVLDDSLKSKLGIK